MIDVINLKLEFPRILLIGGSIMFKYSLRTRILIFILLISMIPVVFVGYSGYSSTKKYIIENEEEKINFFLNNIKQMVVKFFCITKRDILFLEEMTEEKSEYSTEDISGEYKNELENIYYHFSKNNIQYDQIRFVNKGGYEIIRINNNKGKVNIVPDEELQYKGDRYYYQEALKLKKGEIYISDIDLNREKGEIEIPVKPTIRYVTPVYTNDNLRGFLILNLNIEYLFNDIERIKLDNGYNNTIILDSNGYYLFHPDEQKEWGSKRDLNTGESLSKDYTKMSKDIISSKKLSIRTTKENILVWYPVRLKCVGNKKIFIFMEIKKSNHLRPLIGFRNLFIIEAIITILVLIISVIMISSYITKPMIKIVKAVEGIGKGDFDVNLDINTNDELELLGYEIKKMSYELKYMYKNMEEIVGERTKELQLAHREMEEMATKDSLTGLYNRHYFNQYIQSIADDVKNNHKNMMILIIDIDKFKYVNDNYGHNIGDMVLKVVAKFLKNSTIESDLAVRYGGDEFLVALCDSRKINAEKYIKRVEKNLNEWNDNNDILNHRLTLSIGYDEYNGSKHILEAINNADKMMYENKIAKRKKEQG